MDEAIPQGEDEEETIEGEGIHEIGAEQWKTKTPKAGLFLSTTTALNNAAN